MFLQPVSYYPAVKIFPFVLSVNYTINFSSNDNIKFCCLFPLNWKLHDHSLFLDISELFRGTCHLRNL